MNLCKAQETENSSGRLTCSQTDDKRLTAALAVFLFAPIALRCIGRDWPIASFGGSAVFRSLSGRSGH